MYKLDVIIRPEKIDSVLTALMTYGYNEEFIISEVSGRRQNIGKTTIRNYRGHEFVKDTMFMKNKIELYVEKKDIDEIVRIIRNNAKTGEFGDGKIFIYPLDDEEFNTKLNIHNNTNNIDDANNINYEREKLLKELNINLPDDEYIDSLLDSTFKPDSLELRNMEKIAEEKLSNDLLDLLKEQGILFDYKISIDVKYKDKYYYNCDIVLLPKKTFGFIKKNINVNSISKKTENILKSINPNGKVNISIIVY